MTLILIPMLATIPTETSAAVGALFVTAASVAAGLNQINAWIERQKDKPAPADVAKDVVARFVSKEQWYKDQQAIEERIRFLDQQRIIDAKDQAGARKSLYVELEAVRHEMGDMERRLNKADEDRTTAIHNRINDILSAVGELRGVVINGNRK